MTDASADTSAPTRVVTSPVAPKALIEACGLPEIGAHLEGMSVRLDAALSTPFKVVGTTISIRPDVAASAFGSALVLREAIELRAIAGGAPTTVHRVLAHATAAVYAETMLRSLKGWPATSDLIASDVGHALLPPAGDAVCVARSIVQFLLVRDGLAPPSDDELVMISEALPLALPTEVLLTVGGDHRQAIDWEQGINSYGLYPRPIPWTAQFGSCTASAPSERAFMAADESRHRLMRACLAGDLEKAAQSESDRVRAVVLNALRVDPASGAAAVLTPSGTDAELVALAIARHGSRQVRTLIVAPDEIGSGSVLAATGRHFSDRAPMLSNPVEPGAVVEGFDEPPVESVRVQVRDNLGALRPEDEVEAEIERLITDAADRVIVHVVEGSKTGVRLPRFRTVRQWAQRWPTKLRVVVDAAQMRVDQQTIANHVSAGHLVFVTGSKFYGGPPFSGAVLLPREHADTAANLDAGSPGLQAFLSRFDVPAELSGLRAVTTPRPNFGLILRWAAASVELTSFHNASPEIRDEVLRRLAAGIRDHIDTEPRIELLDSPYSSTSFDDQRGLDDLPTIFTFLVLGPNGAPMDYDSARQIQQMMMRDLGGSWREGLAAESAGIGKQSFFLGQAVRVPSGSGRVVGALRVAIGAPTVSRVVFDHTRGRTWEERLAQELADVKRALGKLALVVGNWPDVF